MTMNPSKYGNHLADQQDINYRMLEKKIDTEIAEEHEYSSSGMYYLSRDKAPNPENATYRLVYEWDFEPSANYSDSTIETNEDYTVITAFDIEPGIYFCVTSIEDSTDVTADKSHFRFQNKSAENIWHIGYINTGVFAETIQCCWFSYYRYNDYGSINNLGSSYSASTSRNFGFKFLDNAKARVTFAYKPVSGMPISANIKLYKIS